MTTLTTLLCPESTDATEHLTSALRGAAIGAEIVSTFTGLHDPIPAVAKSLIDLLDTPFGEFLDQAWTDHADVKAAIAETTGKPPTARKVIPLLHERLVITDTVCVKVGGAERASLEPKLTVTVDIDALRIVVSTGRIVAMNPAQLTVEVSLGIGDFDISGGPLPFAFPGCRDEIDLRNADADTLVAPIISGNGRRN